MANTTDYVGTLFDNSESNPSKITLAFTMAGVALKKGHSATVILMMDAVHLAKPHALDNIDIGDPFEPAGELLETFIEKGGQVLVCGACMKHNDVEEPAIDKRFNVISGDDVVELLMNATGSLQLN
ncbi:DsrE family protein [Psychrobacter namhaensis]|jgi:predicted peroxiredoxin|uniref:DsrE family protein n=1 Tax=Psychrobacter namhaensis TaxID=292734 RepID=UPI0018DFF41A|nr:DsrE family protein [Psychrobacter namhaensis]|tara:strand:+ start:544 stop:921 length:378 start_codon:yes stop_codon:yes gene_type:complete